MTMTSLVVVSYRQNY